jgi:hypothetical protein
VHHHGLLGLIAQIALLVIDMKVLPRNFKSLFVTLLALFAAIAVTLCAVQFRMWWQGTSTETQKSSTAVSDAAKLRLLASIATTSTASVSERSKALQALSPSSTTESSANQHLQILDALH